MIDPADVTKECETMYAFACPSSQGNLPQSGMTLRDYFAGQALVGICSRGEAKSRTQAQYAYEIADAMMAERDKP